MMGSRSRRWPPSQFTKPPGLVELRRCRSPYRKRHAVIRKGLVHARKLRSRVRRMASGVGRSGRGTGETRLAGIRGRSTWARAELQRSFPGPHPRRRLVRRPGKCNPGLWFPAVTTAAWALRLSILREQLNPIDGGRRLAGQSPGVGPPASGHGNGWRAASAAFSGQIEYRASSPRAITSDWISLVPSPIIISGASR